MFPFSSRKFALPGQGNHEQLRVGQDSPPRYRAAGKELDMVGHFQKPHVHNREIGERGEGLQDTANGRALAREAARRSAQVVDPSKEKAICRSSRRILSGTGGGSQRKKQLPAPEPPTHYKDVLIGQA